MIDNRKLVVRMDDDGINHTAVIMDYCGNWYERERGHGFSELDAINDLISSLRTKLFMLEDDLDLAIYGTWKREDLNDEK